MTDSMMDDHHHHSSSMTNRVTTEESMKDLYEASLNNNHHDPAVLLYTVEQQKILFWLPKLPALLSLTASVLVLYVLLRQAKERLAKVYGRVWFGICLGNVLTCVGVLLSTVTAPAGTYYGSMGTDESCVVSAAIMHWFMVYTTVYNGFLGVYYYISIHNHCTDRWLRKTIEPWVHTAAFVMPTLGVILALHYNLYGVSDLFMYCWVAPTPFACRQNTDLECTEGGFDTWWRPLFIWGLGMVELNAFTLPKLMGVFAIYYTLLKQHAKMQRKYHTNKNAAYKHNSVARETGIQAYWFLAACLLPYFIKIMARVLDMFAPPSYWHGPATPALVTMMIVGETLYPLQGIVNAVIFFRPKIKHRQRERRHRNESTLRSLYAVLFPKRAALEEKRVSQSRHNQMFRIDQDQQGNDNLRETRHTVATSSVYRESTLSANIRNDTATSCLDEEGTGSDPDHPVKEIEADHSPHHQVEENFDVEHQMSDDDVDDEDLEEKDESEESSVNDMDAEEMMDDGFVPGEDLPEDFYQAHHQSSHRSGDSSSLTGSTQSDGRRGRRHRRSSRREGELVQQPNQPLGPIAEVSSSMNPESMSMKPESSDFRMGAS